MNYVTDFHNYALLLLSKASIYSKPDALNPRPYWKWRWLPLLPWSFLDCCVYSSRLGPCLSTALSELGVPFCAQACGVAFPPKLLDAKEISYLRVTDCHCHAPIVNPIGGIFFTGSEWSAISYLCRVGRYCFLCATLWLPWKVAGIWVPSLQSSDHRHLIVPDAKRQARSEIICA